MKFIKWENEEDAKLLTVLQTRTAVTGGDIMQLIKECPGRSGFAVYKRLIKIAKDHGISFESKDIMQVIAPNQKNKKRENRKQKYQQGSAPLTIQTGILQAMADAAMEYMKREIYNEVELKYKSAFDAKYNKLKEEDDGHRKLLCELKDVREVVEKYQSSLRKRR